MSPESNDGARQNVRIVTSESGGWVVFEDDSEFRRPRILGAFSDTAGLLANLGSLIAPNEKASLPGWLSKLQSCQHTGAPAQLPTINEA